MTITLKAYSGEKNRVFVPIGRGILLRINILKRREHVLVLSGRRYHCKGGNVDAVKHAGAVGTTILIVVKIIEVINILEQKGAKNEIGSYLVSNVQAEQQIAAEYQLVNALLMDIVRRKEQHIKKSDSNS